MVISHVVGEPMVHCDISHPSGAATPEGREVPESAAIARCLDAVRGETDGGDFDEKAHRRELARLEAWLRAHGGGSVLSASSNQLALYMGRSIREGLPHEQVARRMKSLRRFYGCLKRLGFREDDPMADIRLYSMSGGTSQRL